MVKKELEFVNITQEEDIDDVKSAVFETSSRYLKLALSTDNSKKFSGKKVEVNFLKTLGKQDVVCKGYRESVNQYLVGLDKNKQEIYIE